ncbi:MAG: DUF4129 domain-containing protein [Archangium sp.]
MTALALALLLAAPCNRPRPPGITDAQQQTACDFATSSPGARNTPANLASIYERDGFERARERNSGALQAWLAQARAWFLALFETRGAETYSNITRIAVLVAAIALTVLVIVRVRRRRREIAASKTTTVETALELDDPAIHRARAEALLAEDPRESMREALLSVLSMLERRRLARPDRTRTNRELSAELPANGAPPELVAQVAPLFTWFDRTFYSLAAVAPDEARRFLDDARVLTEREA